MMRSIALVVLVVLLVLPLGEIGAEEEPELTDVQKFARTGGLKGGKARAAKLIEDDEPRLGKRGPYKERPAFNAN